MRIRIFQTRHAATVVDARKRCWWRLGATIGALVLCLVISEIYVNVALWRAQICLESRQHRRALAWLQSVAWHESRNAEWQFLLARTNRRLERFPEVRTHLQRASELGWARGDLEREQWLALAQTGQYAAMRAHWGDLFLNAGSDGPEICRAFVTAALKQFQVAEALHVIAGWKADFPEDPEPYFQEARIAGVALRWHDAEVAYREALQRAPARQDAREGLIDALVHQLKYAEADSELKQLLQRDPSNLAVQFQHADCLMRLGELDQARTLLQSVLHRDGAPDQARVLLGQLELGAGHPQAAVAALAPAVANHAEDAEVRYLYAKSLRAAGRDAEAAEHFRFREAAKEPLLRLSKATAELIAAPRDRALRYEVGELTWRWKSHEEGATWLLSLLDLDSAHAPTHALLARHYELLGDRVKAEHHRQQARAVEFHE